MFSLKEIWKQRRNVFPKINLIQIFTVVCDIYDGDEFVKRVSNAGCHTGVGYPKRRRM
jgi:hypothetical protein